MRPVELRPDLASLPPYRAPQESAPVRLNTNESPVPPPPAFLSTLSALISEASLNRYPDRDARALRAGLASFAGVTTEGVWVANGSNEILQTMLLAFGGPGRTLLLFEPTYAMYPHLASVTMTPVASRTLPEPWVVTGDVVRAAIAEEHPTSTFLCSPNNPTGRAVTLDVVRAALDQSDGLVVVDQAYGEFGGDDATALVADHDRLVVVRSFSKSWRLAGARIGWLVAQPWLIEAIQVARLPYHLSAVTQAAGLAALEHRDALVGACGELSKARDSLASSMREIAGIDVFDSDANFLLFRTPLDGRALWTALSDRGVLVRDFSGVIPRALRVTVSTAEENSAFLTALRGILEDS